MSADISVLQAGRLRRRAGTDRVPAGLLHRRTCGSCRPGCNPDINQPGFTAFTAVIQLGTMAAVVLYFWRELLHVTVAWLRGLVDRQVRGTLEYRMGWYLILATVPVGVFGLVFRHQIDDRRAQPLGDRHAR